MRAREFITELDNSRDSSAEFNPTTASGRQTLDAITRAKDSSSRASNSDTASTNTDTPQSTPNQKLQKSSQSVKSTSNVGGLDQEGSPDDYSIVYGKNSSFGANESMQVVVPHSFAAARQLSADTEWTIKNNVRQFKKYQEIGKGAIYIIIPEKSSEKLLLLCGSEGPRVLLMRNNDKISPLMLEEKYPDFYKWIVTRTTQDTDLNITKFTKSCTIVSGVIKEEIEELFHSSTITEFEQWAEDTHAKQISGSENTTRSHNIYTEILKSIQTFPNKQYEFLLRAFSILYTPGEELLSWRQGFRVRSNLEMSIPNIPTIYSKLFADLYKNGSAAQESQYLSKWIIHHIMITPRKTNSLSSEWVKVGNADEWWIYKRLEFNDSHSR